MFGLRISIVVVLRLLFLSTVLCVALQSRIFGGEDSPNPISYQVSLQKLRSGQWNHFCGGSIISAWYVITAAHCVDKEKVPRLSILAGSTKRSSNSSRYLIGSYTVHPNFGRGNHHDIALVRSRTPFHFNSNIAPIHYQNRRYIPNGLRCRISGWGVMERIRNASFPDDLQTAVVWTISNRLCRRYYDVSTNELCTLGLPDEGTCAGDSGGPLVNWDNSLLLGVVSHGSTYCGTGVPDVYTRISVFVDWINSVVVMKI